MKHQDATANVTRAIANRRGRTFYVQLVAIAADQQRRSDGFYQATTLDRHCQRVFQRLASLFVETAKYFIDLLALCILQRPTGQVFRDRVQVIDDAVFIGGYHAVADGLQGNLRAFFLTKQLFFVGLALGNVEFDTDQAAHVARLCPQGEHTAMHPSPTACTMPHAMSALETVGAPIHISTHFALNATQVIRVHQVPPIGGVRQLVLCITQHGFPAW